MRIPLGFVSLYGIISQVGANAVPERLVSEDSHGNRWLTVQLIGEGQAGLRFDRGISQYPTVGDSVHLVTDADLQTIYGRPDDPRYVQIGQLAAAESIPALVDIGALVTRHSAIVGTTGSGKSTTVVSLLSALSDGKRYPSARILVIDIHGEYGNALRDRAAIFRTNAVTARGEKPLYIPYWAMTFEELLPFTFGSLEGSSRGTAIERIADLKRQSVQKVPRRGVALDRLTVDTAVPFSIHKLWFDLHTEMRATHVASAEKSQSRDTWALELDAKDNAIEPGDVMRCIAPRFRPPKDVKNDSEKIRLSASPLNLGREVDGLGSKLRDPRLAFLFNPGPYLPDPEGGVDEDLESLLASWLGEVNPVTILDLSGIPPSIQTDLVGALLRIIHDALFWARNLSEGGRERPLLIVLEEAHAYLGSGSEGTAAAAVRRIAKEGRKYGIGVMLVSQRPSEIDPTILSQCGTLIALRLTNATDRGHIRSAASDNLEGLFSMLPILRTGEAIIVGEAVNLPVRTLIERPSAGRRPDSEDPTVVVRGSEEEGYETPGGWNQKRDPSNYAEVVELWRRQDARSPRVHSGESEKTRGE